MEFSPAAQTLDHYVSNNIQNIFSVLDVRSGTIGRAKIKEQREAKGGTGVQQDTHNDWLPSRGSEKTNNLTRNNVDDETINTFENEENNNNDMEINTNEAEPLVNLNLNHEIDNLKTEIERLEREILYLSNFKSTATEKLKNAR